MALDFESGVRTGLDLESLVEDGASLVHREVFWRQDIYELELEKIFARSWNFLCHESQIPNRGDRNCPCEQSRR